MPNAHLGKVPKGKIFKDEKDEIISLAMLSDEEKTEMPLPLELKLNLVDKASKEVIAEDLIFYLIQYRFAEKPTYVCFFNFN